MKIDLIAKAVIDRIKADTGTGGIYEGNTYALVGGVYQRSGSPSAESDLAKPYIVFNLNINTQGILKGAMHDVELKFDIVSPAATGTSGAGVDVVIDRLFGDRLSATGQTPTYGFDNHQLVLDTNTFGWTCNTVQFRSLSPTVLDQARWLTTLTFAFQTIATATG